MLFAYKMDFIHKITKIVVMNGNKKLD